MFYWKLLRNIITKMCQKMWSKIIWLNSVPFFKICVGNFFWCSFRFRQIQWRCRLHSSKKGNWWNITLGLNRSCKLKDDINVILQFEKLQAERQYVGLQTSFKLRELFTILTKRRDLDELVESALQWIVNTETINIVV